MSDNVVIKPILKWAGGKSQLLDEIVQRFPEYVHKQDFCLIEPFVGGGAVSFWALSNLPNLKKLIINDYNADLINLYKVIRDCPDSFLEEVQKLQLMYDNLITLEEKKPVYYQMRDLFNERTQPDVMQACLFVFLNKTGFNGLYRVNRNNHFNVPIGSYKKPKFVSNDHVLALSEKLQQVEILTGDFEQTLEFIPQNLPCLFYIDPPYRPISDTASFTAYANNEFNDDEQIRLAKFCRTINELGCQFVLSNSDPKNHDVNDDFFDELYSEFNIQRIQANRAISAKGSGRKAITELLIDNI